MNFFEHQAAARRTSTRLVLLFALAVLVIVLVVDGLVWMFMGPQLGPLAIATVATLLVIGLGSVYRVASLRGGGDPVALQMGGVAVAEDTTDPDLRRLRNVVEEIAIASGVPVPGLYVLEHESAINAFAAGFAPSDAVIAVTRGALNRLNRDELQGVIAHEFSHILNGDMRLNIRLIGLLFGILMLALIGRKVMWFGSVGRRDKGALAMLAVALVAIALGYVGMFFARMIKAGVSRSRERLADASAVQFTRQTEGLAGALKKIGGLHEGAKLSKRSDAEEVSHMLFGDGVGLSGWFATHPPLIERIQALEPSFRPDQLEALSRQWLAEPPSGLDEDVRMGFSGQVPPPLPPARAEQSLTPPMAAARVAQTGDSGYQQAGALIGHLPDELRALAGRRELAPPLVLGLLLDQRAEVVDRQLYEIQARMGAVVAGQVRQLRREHLADLHPILRLPLASLAFPALRVRPPAEVETFLDAVGAIVRADGEVVLFEYCLATLLTLQLRESMNPGRHGRIGRRSLRRSKPEVATLLAMVAEAGHGDSDTARRAYLAGLQRVLPSDHIEYAPPAAGLQALDEVWQPLDALEPVAKQLLVEALTAAIGHDGRVYTGEAELLRTICGALHCPLPPLMPEA